MKRTYLTLIVLMLLIGFAAVSANLVINGTINFGFNSNNFNDGVVFTYTNTMHGEATILDEGKSITFKTTKLEDVGQKAILDFDIANKSNQYDASVTINCGLEKESELYEEYINIDKTLEDTFEITSGETKNGRLTITLKKAYDQEEKDVNMLCTITATPEERDTEGTYTPKEHQYEEILLNGADPVLDVSAVEEITLAVETNEKELIPVTIDDDGTVTRADTTKEWYDYETKKWANAVILNDGVKDPGANKEISEEKIESYFVWIPKYRYKLWNVDNDNPVQNAPFAIEIKFGTEDTTDDNDGECTTPLNVSKSQALSGSSGNCNNGEWMTHPAFITMDVPGFWVGKFEVGYKQDGEVTSWTKEGAQKENEDSTKVIVKPNVYSWRNITIKNMFNSLLKYATNLDSHMMKNTEWGAVAILSHTIYGINNEVAQNTNADYLTGYAKTSDSIVPYNSSEGVKASTTGNITGIYDMSGGAWERMAAYRDVASTTDAIGSSRFTKQETITIGEKYFDVYDKESAQNSYDKRILGDATGEMGPFSNYRGSWYQDYAGFVESASPWFSRGGGYSAGSGIAGQFYFGWNNGGTYVVDGSRLVLAPRI